MLKYQAKCSQPGASLFLVYNGDVNQGIFILWKTAFYRW